MAISFDRVPHVPGSPYAAELNREHGSMRFPPELEREYHGFYLAARRSHVRFFNAVIGGLVALALAAVLIVDHPASDAFQLARVSTITATFLGLALLARSRYFERAYLPTATVASLLVSFLAAVEVAYWVAAGFGELFGLLTVYSVGLYFLAGILFHGAIRANAVLVFSFAGTLAVLGEDPVEIGYLTAMLAGTATIVGLAFRNQGIQFRRTFLERGLIAEMAARDGLTGLKNRRAFDEHLTRAWQHALRERRSLVVLLIDVDHFKPYNDHYGHQAGDDALQKVSTVVGDFARRPLDMAARFGGEEIAVVLFDLARERVVKIAEQLRAAVQALSISHTEQPTASIITVSIGAAIVRPVLDRSPEGAVQLADEALYAAKKDGRNRVRVFESEYKSLATGRFKMH